MPVAPRIVNHVSYVTTINHENDFAWQVQYLMSLQCRFSWQAQYLMKLNCHFSWQAGCRSVTFPGRRSIG